MDLEKILEKYKLQIGIGLVGLILIGLGGFFLLFGQEPSKVEIISEESSAVQKTIFIDLGGAVEKPGVYELPPNSRINDLFVQAGGLSAEADRDWLAQNINLAQRLSDGAKIYIPKKSEVQQFGGPAAFSGEGQVAGITSKINVNTATVVQLDSLWGIGEKRAADIIANRPYQTIEELMTKAKIPKNVFEKIKEKVTVY